MPSYTFVSYEEGIMTVIYKLSWIAKLLGYKDKELRFYGSSTVWHHYPSYQRASTDTESILSDFYTMAMHKRRLAVKEKGRCEKE